MKRTKVPSKSDRGGSCLSFIEKEDPYLYMLAIDKNPFGRETVQTEK